MAMDKPRANPPKKRGKLYASIAIVAAVILTVGLSQLKPAPPSVDRQLAWTDTVERGTMVRNIRGPGTLVPEQIQIIAAVTNGRVVEKLVDPGVTVEPNTVLLRLENPDVQLNLLAEQRQLTSGRSALVSMETTLASNRLNQEAAVAQIVQQYSEAARTDSVNEELWSKQLITRNEYLTAKDNLEQLKTRVDIERQKLAMQVNSIESQLEAQRAEIDQLERMVAFRQDQLESMNVTAGTSGVLQRLGQTGDLEIGQYILSGQELARVVQPGRLKAVLRIPETQAVDVVVGLAAEIDTRNGVIHGRVVRIDPAAQGGTVGVDVALPEDLPPGARPDLSVDGRIIISQLDDVLHVGRQQYANPRSTIGLFKLEPDGNTAVRVPVQIGEASVNEMEVVSGLREGDVVILSDMSQWDSYDRIRLR
jgi:multidrug resistance efflux pump